MPQIPNIIYRGRMGHVFMEGWGAIVLYEQPPLIQNTPFPFYIALPAVWWVVMTTGLPAASLPGIGFVPPLIGAQEPSGLHCCSQTTLWWSFIADAFVSKSLLLSSLFWFMYSLIYLCIWTRGGGKRLGERRGWNKEDSNSYNACYYTQGNACGTFAF